MNILRAGPPSAPNTLVLLHGRGAPAETILTLFQELQLSSEWNAVAPQAPGNSWYPYSFLAPVQQNQPHLDQSLQSVEEIVSKLTSENVAILGFSQGACLALEFSTRFPRRYAGIMALTGGLITLQDRGSLLGTPIFLGSGDPDAHVPFRRVEESALHLRSLGARVEIRRYPGLPHTINHDQLNYCRELLAATKGIPK